MLDITTVRRRWRGRRRRGQLFHSEAERNEYEGSTVSHLERCTGCHETVLVVEKNRRQYKELVTQGAGGEGRCSLDQGGGANDDEKATRRPGKEAAGLTARADEAHW